MKIHEVSMAVSGSTLPPTERLVLMQMAQASGPNPTCYASQEKLAKDTGCGLRQLGTLIASLERRRILEHRGKHAVYGTDVWAFHLDRIEKGTPDRGRRGKGVRRPTTEPVDNYGDETWDGDESYRIVRDP